MTRYCELDGVCYLPLGGRLPEGAKPSGLFSPLVLLVDRDPAVSRGIFAIRDPRELDEAEGPELLRPVGASAPSAAPLSGTLDPEAAALILRDGACVLNTAFGRSFAMLRRFLAARRDGLRVNVAGLGDVGGTVLTGLVLLGTQLSEIGVFDFYEPLMHRYELELNQVLPTAEGRTMPCVIPRSENELFDCDAFLFTASKSVPPVGSEVRDVRMAQYAANRALLRPYARAARDTGFAGLFCQISDPVDQLARYVFLESNRDEAGRFDWNGLLPEQVQGFGLGVMEARARFLARRRGEDFTRGAVYGPHGQDLIAANDPEGGYDDARSRELSRETAAANLEVRELGFKPYIAPGLSSAAISVLRALGGEWHDGAVPLGGAYFGCQSRLTRLGMELRRRDLHPDLFARITDVHRRLREFDCDG